MIKNLKQYRATLLEAAGLDEADFKDIQQAIQEREAQDWRDRFWEKGCNFWPFLPECVERLRAGDFKTLRDLAATYKVSLPTASAIKRSILRSGRMAFPELSRCLPGSPGLTDLQGNTIRDHELRTMTYTERRLSRSPGGEWAKTRELKVSLADLRRAAAVLERRGEP